ncbi:MAG TPA: hypothetical protein VHS09_06600, partial [Polyangiaceae bacterium]|nr:hypothetical protein [Polyangiaceae bacterium]
VFASIMGATVGSFFLFPKTYHVETKALAQPTSALTVRGDGPSADTLTRAAADTVLRQDNLLALIKETDLLAYTRDHRAPVQRARDAVVRLVRGHDESEADQLDALVKRLETKLVVWTSDSANAAGGSTVTIAIDWSDATMACRLVDAAQQAFLAARYAREVTALSESIAILSKHATILKTDVDDAVAAIERMRPGADTSKDAPRAEGASPSAPARSRVLMMQRPRSPRADSSHLPPSPEIQAKQQAIDELEDLRRRRLSELQARLAEARAIYTENHPTIVDLKQSIAALSVESAQVGSLRQEIAALKAEREEEVAQASGSSASVPPVTWVPAPAGTSSSAAATPPQLPSDVLRIALDLREDRDPAMVYARGQLRDAMDKYAALRAQIQGAQIDLETAQAAFKYRYTVVTPARLPRSPTVPNIPVVTLVAFVVALLCAFLLAVLVDLRRGRLLERWQLERLLDRPVLGELALPDELESA